MVAGLGAAAGAPDGRDWLLELLELLDDELVAADATPAAPRLAPPTTAPVTRTLRIRGNRGFM
jgi:hypothetical protein